MRLLASVAALAALVTAGCNNSMSSGGAGGRSTAITVGNDFYSITPDTVASGAQITWTWATPSNGHTVSWDSGPAGSTLPAGSATMTSGTYNATLTTVGTYHYHCLIHGAVMSGVIVIQ